MQAPTLTQLIDAFNERLIALEVFGTGRRSTHGHSLIAIGVREQWQQTDVGQNAHNVEWSLNEPALPTVAWYQDSDDAINWDYRDQGALEAHVFMRLSIDPARIAAVLERLERIPVASPAERDSELSRQIAVEALAH